MCVDRSRQCRLVDIIFSKELFLIIALITVSEILVCLYHTLYSITMFRIEKCDIASLLVKYLYACITH
jgi:hypothetical protein